MEIQTLGVCLVAFLAIAVDRRSLVEMPLRMISLLLRCGQSIAGSRSRGPTELGRTVLCESLKVYTASDGANIDVSARVLWPRLLG